MRCIGRGVDGCRLAIDQLRDQAPAWRPARHAEVAVADGEESQRRVAEILRKAAADIRAITRDDDIDL